MKAYVFPGQGSQFPTMGKALFEEHAPAKAIFEQANDILGFNISEIMFEGTAEALQQTKVTQPAIFIHSVALAKVAPDYTPDMVAGHSLGEFSALVTNGTLEFEDGLRLVSTRALAMQKACEAAPSTMAAIIGLEAAVVEEITAEVNEVMVVVPANYNMPQQIVISGSTQGVQIAMERMKEAGARKVVELKVSGAFHSPFMEPAKQELEEAIHKTTFNTPSCPIYQNVTAKPTTDIAEIKNNLIAQLTAPVRWTQTVEQMHADGATVFVECGPGKVLRGLVKKIIRGVETQPIMEGQEPPK